MAMRCVLDVHFSVCLQVCRACSGMLTVATITGAHTLTAEVTQSQQLCKRQLAINSASGSTHHMHVGPQVEVLLGVSWAPCLAYICL